MKALLSAVAACGQASCPVPTLDEPLLDDLRTTTLPAGTWLRRAHHLTHPDPARLAPPRGDARFSPLPRTLHAYLATSTIAVLLETAFHDAAPPCPRIADLVLRRWAESAVRTGQDLQLVDLRDAELARLGLARSDLVAATAAHYPCTRTWAVRLQHRRIDGAPVAGLLWHSRQAELYADASAQRPALRDLTAAERHDVAVVWSPPAPASVLATSEPGLGLLDAGPGRRYVDDAIALLGIVTQ